MKVNDVMPEPDVLRADLMERLKRFGGEDLAVLHRVVLQFEKEQLWKEYSSAMAADWEAGKYQRMDEIIREAREAIRQRQ